MGRNIGLGRPSGYYDSAGALRDMIQNHLLQLLCLVAMESPASFEEGGFRDRKVDVLKAVRKPSAGEVREDTIRARYTTGRIGAADAPNYVDEPGVRSERQTETFAQVRLWIDNWRWIGVFFVLRTGKALKKNRQEILIYFRSVPHLPFQRAQPIANKLRLRFGANCIELGLNIIGQGAPFDLQRVDLDTQLAPQSVPEYSRLLLDVLEGDATLSIRGDEAEESWRIVEPILAEWSKRGVPLQEYPAGSDGPQ
jgi:glucose-6-phosphate 1-dehydrogenase